MLGRHRHILATGFERDGDGWLYYRNGWSGGVPVSSEERELYLAGRWLQWRRRVSGRKAVAPRRPYWRTLRRMGLALLLGDDPGGSVPGT